MTFEKRAPAPGNDSQTAHHAASADEDKSRDSKCSTLKSQSTTMDRMMSRSSLAPVLSEYGLSANEAPKRRTTHKNKESSQRQKHKPSRRQPEEPDEASESQKKYYMQVYRDMHRGKQLCYEEYLEKMRDKVDEQRQQIRKRTQDIENRMRAQEEREREESHRVKRRLQRIEVGHDDGFLDSLPKSEYYKIIAVQKKMQDLGELRTRADDEEFWESIRQPGVLNFYCSKYMPSAANKNGSQKSSHSQDGSTVVSVGARSRTSSTSSQIPPEREPRGAPPVDFRPMTGIEELKESSRPATRDDAAPTRLAEPLPKDRTPSPKRKLDPYTIAKLAAVELDKKYPQKEIPELFCLNMEFGKKPPDAEEVFKEMEKKRRDKERQLYIKRLRKMYQLSQTHGASAQRILHQHEQSEDLFLQGPPLNDLLAIDRLLSPEVDTPPRSQVTDLNESRPWQRHLGVRRQIVPIEEESDYLSTGRTGRTVSAKRSAQSRKSSASSVHDEETVADQPPALSLHAVREHSKTLEAKCLSSMWNNYLGVGKSVFAPT